MQEQPFSAWRLSLKQDASPRLVLVLNLRHLKRSGLPDAFFEEIALLLQSFDDVQGLWTRAGPYEFAVAPQVNERAALEFTMRLRTGVRARYYKHALALSLGDLDQAKAIQPFTWPQRRAELNEALRGLMESSASEGSWRPLSLGDIAALRDLLPAISAEEWQDRVMGSQAVVLFEPGGAATTLVREHYCRIAQVRQLIDPGVDLRGNDLLFALMLGHLDLKVMETAPRWVADGRWSINLSIATVLSRDFAVFVDMVPVRGAMIEIKQSDLMLQYHRAMKAIGLLREMGVAVAVDLVWADSLGLVAYERIPGLAAVKVPFQPNQAERLVHEKPTLRRFLEAGLVPVLTRVGDQVGVETGLRAGIRAFQGDHVTQLIRPRDPG